MDIETRHERKQILRQIDLLEIGRCEKCSAYAAYGDAIRCKCDVAVEIRALGEQLVSISRKKRQGEIDNLVKAVKQTGLTPELYRGLREYEISIKKLCAYTGWNLKKMNEWRSENGFEKPISQREITLVKRRGTIAEQLGLTLETYTKEKDAGVMDKDIRKKYQISTYSLLKFKKQNGLALPRGEHERVWIEKEKVEL